MSKYKDEEDENNEIAYKGFKSDNHIKKQARKTEKLHIIPYEQIEIKGEREKMAVSLVDADILAEIETKAKLFSGSPETRDKKRRFCLSLAVGNSAYVAAKHSGKDWHNLLYRERKKDEVFAEIWKVSEAAFSEVITNSIEKIELEKAAEHDARGEALWDMWQQDPENKELLAEARKFFEAGSKIRSHMAQVILRRKISELPPAPNTIVNITQQQNVIKEALDGASDEQLTAILEVARIFNANQKSDE